MEAPLLSELEMLKLRLLNEGLTISAPARRRLAGDDGLRPLTAADYASTSGVALRLGDRIWVNAPIIDHNPNFVSDSSHVLELVGDGFVVRSGDLEVEALPLPVPDYLGRRNEVGERYTDYAYTHTDRVRIAPIEGCALTCKFCDLPYEFRYRRKSVEGLVDAVRVALHDTVLPAAHVLVSGGTPREEDYDYLDETYAAVTSAFPGVAVDVMMVPMPGLLDAKRLAAIGVNQMAINVELVNEGLARRIMPRKAAVGLQTYLDFIEKVRLEMGPGSVRSLLLVGIEPLKDTLRGVRLLAERGCEPVLSPFRPDPSTPMRDALPPSVELQREAYLRSRDIAEALGVKLGPRCIPCQHNTLTFPDDSGYYTSHGSF